jgi:uncharacterized protein YkwD
MKFRLLGLSILFLLLVVAANTSVIQSQNKNEPTASTLSQDEKDLLKEINEARAHPDVYASYLEQLKPLFAGKIYKGSLQTEEGWAAVEEAIAFMRTMKPQPPFNVATGLCSAALTHVKEQSGSGATGHKSASSGAMIEDRVKPFGSWQGNIGENLSYGSDSARERLLTWLIDDGFASRGHRKRVMSSDYKVAGICCGPHPEFGKMCVLTLAGGFNDTVAAKPAAAAESSAVPSQSATSTTSSKVSNGNANTTSGSNTSGENSNKAKTTNTKPRKR